MSVGRQKSVSSGMSRTDRILIITIVLAASVFPVDLQPGTQREPRGTDGQFSGKQGQVLLVPIATERAPAAVTGRFLGRRILFYQRPGSGVPGEYLGLLGIDMQDPPGTHELIVDVHSPPEDVRLSYNVVVVDKHFPVQKLTLPKDKVELDKRALIRVKAEQRQVRRVLGLVSQEPRWAKSFIVPVGGVTSGAFGRRRVINGQPRSPHSGEDIAAPMGANVLATNDGIVRLTVDHFFSGKGIFVDHGLGLHSMYFHLSEISVVEGQLVRRGEVIGQVGASGRATGPHLHWGIRLNGARVDPYSLTTLPLDGTGPLAARRTED